MNDSPRPRGFNRRRFMQYVGVSGAVSAAVATSSDRAVAAPGSAGGARSVAQENALPGSPPDEWESWDADDNIAGFTTRFSVLPGQTVEFKVATEAAGYRIRIYRLGWYQGNGARHLADLEVPVASGQPAPVVDVATGLVDCGNWSVNASWTVPDDAVSGVYYALFDPTDGSRSSHTIFVVRRQGPSDVLVQTSEMTMHAYNPYGGNSLYYGEPVGRAYKVSYNRPFNNGEAESNFLNAEIALVRWLERNGFDVAYCGGIDVHQDASVARQGTVFISSGHDEYVTGPQRDHVEAARDAGTHLIFMTGNEYFWRVRFEPSIDGSDTPDRTMVCYKETLANAKIDPEPEWTGTWRDPRFSPPSNGGRPENQLTGQLFRAILPVSSPDYRITVPAEYAGHRIWRDTDVALLQPGQTRDLSPNTLGYEFDVDADNGFRPPGLIRLSSTEAEVPQLLTDYGATYVQGTCTHHLTMYRAASGALVWGTGTVQWSYGLDDYHICDPGTPTDPAMQQATLNVLADMGVYPDTLQQGMVSAIESADTLPPTTTISTPASGTQVPVGSPVTVTGTAVDSGGGLVAAIEVSTDGGETWHPATGRDSWSLVVTPVRLGELTVAVRAIDDSCNIGHASLLPLTVVPRGYPCGIWPEGAVPATEAVDETTPIEVGVRFTADTDGFVTGLRFYKGEGNTGTHVGTLWTAQGVELVRAEFDAETASGWQQVTVPAVALTAGTTYVISVFMPAGRYAADAGYFAQEYALPPLRALANGEGGTGNGVYRYGSPGFPQSTFGASNYWVDILFDIDNQQAPTVVDHAPGAGLQSVAPTTSLTATFNEAIAEGTIEMTLADADGVLVAGVTAYDPGNRTATFTPEAPLAPLRQYSVTVQGAVDTTGNTMTPFTWSFTTIGPPGTSPTSLWDTSAAPATTDADRSPVELGLRFTTTAVGTVTALRFHKAATSGGTHVGHLWDESGQLLATATYSHQTGSGWQQVPLSNPVEIGPGHTYVVSYHAPLGVYGATAGMFNTTGWERGPLRALPGDHLVGNGVFRYGDGGFPTNSWGNANYWVDVVFEIAPDTGPPEVVDVEPAPGLVAVSRTTTVRARFDEPIDPATLSITVRDGDGQAVAGDTAYDPDTATVTFTPAASLGVHASHSVAVEAHDLAGNPMREPFQWGFTTVAAPGTSPVTLWDTSARPAQEAVDDAAAVELGVRFRSSRAGRIVGLRYYRGEGNTGPHVGRLWGADGSLLATATFGTEMRRGWQQTMLADPVPVQPGVTYVASYHAPAGRYAATGGGLSSAHSNGPLTAPASSDQAGNGLFAYGAGGFPTGTWGSGNYWVDVIFEDATAPSVVSRSPETGANVTADTDVRVTFDEAVDPASLVLTLRDSTGSTVPGTVTYDAAELTAVLTPGGPLAAGATYTAALESAADPEGNALGAPVTWSFAVAGTGYLSLWETSVTPATELVDDAGPVNLGLRFRSATSGSVHGVRFFKGGPANAGPHVGVLWSAAGEELARVTFAGESARGWQTAMFATPVAITAGELYAVSYLAPQGHYSVNGAYFAGSGRANGPLEAPSSDEVGGNGVFRYSSEPAVPQQSWNGGNYWVDVLFMTD